MNLDLSCLLARRLFSLTAALAIAHTGCDTSTDYPTIDAQEVRTLEQLVDDYESGALSRDDFRAAIAAMDDSGMPAELTRDLKVTTLLAARAQPYRVTTDILWNNLGWIDSGQPNDIALNGMWWAIYNQVDEVQAILDARYNIVASAPGGYPGEGNIADEPMLVFDGDGTPLPAPGSPAIDSGLLAFEDVPMDLVRAYLSTDVRGRPRARNNDTYPDIDRGAVEVQ